MRQALDKLVCAATDVHGGASRTLEQLQLYLRLHAIDQQNSEVSVLSNCSGWLLLLVQILDANNQAH